MYVLNKAICCIWFPPSSVQQEADVLWPNLTKVLKAGTIPLALVRTQWEHMCV